MKAVDDTPEGREIQRLNFQIDQLCREKNTQSAELREQRLALDVLQEALVMERLMRQDLQARNKALAAQLVQAGLEFDAMAKVATDHAMNAPQRAKAVKWSMDTFGIEHIAIVVQAIIRGIGPIPQGTARAKAVRQRLAPLLLNMTQGKDRAPMGRTLVDIEFNLAKGLSPQQIAKWAKDA